MHFECEVGHNPGSKPPCRFIVELEQALYLCDLSGEFWPEVLLVASPARQVCCFLIGSVVLEVSPAGPLDSLHCACFECQDHLVQVIPGCSPYKLIHK